MLFNRSIRREQLFVLLRIIGGPFTNKTTRKQRKIQKHHPMGTVPQWSYVNLCTCVQAKEITANILPLFWVRCVLTKYFRAGTNTPAPSISYSRNSTRIPLTKNTMVSFYFCYYLPYRTPIVLFLFFKRNIITSSHVDDDTIRIYLP